MRAWTRDWREEHRDFVVHLFGSDDANAQSAGSIIIFDALPVTTPELALEVITPHDGGWRIKKNVTPSDWVRPVPIHFLGVKEGAKFLFAIAPRASAGKNDVKDAYQLIEEALEWIGAGAKNLGRLWAGNKPGKGRGN